MHSFLRSIGFSHLTTRIELDELLAQMIRTATEKTYMDATASSPAQIEMRQRFGERFGISLRGEYDEKLCFHLEHYYPYCTNRMISATEELTINRRVDADSYTGMCDDSRLGVSLIFYLQNPLDYLKLGLEPDVAIRCPIHLSALSISGSVLLGIDTPDSSENHSSDWSKRTRLITEAKNGNQDAIDSLTMEDLDLHALVNRRIHTEDLYTIVETSFVPYGSESDNYSIIGTILNVHYLQNTDTQESVYVLIINCNDIIFPVTIHEDDLVGEPAIGRRFKGNIWMQGFVDFPTHIE